MDDNLDRLLTAPVGSVVNTLNEILDCPVNLEITKQFESAHRFVRMVSIFAKGLPVINAHVQFDPEVLPKIILDDILKKKDGLGDILTQRNICATRKMLSLNHDLNNNKITRAYEIIKDGSVWFTISEDFLLGNLHSCQNGRSSQR